MPVLAERDAAPLAALAGRVAVEGPCAQRRDIRRLQQRAVALVNAGRVPDALQEPFLSGFAALAAEAPVCTPGLRPHPVAKEPAASQPTRVAPVPHAARVEREARNLERWLEAYSTRRS